MTDLIALRLTERELWFLSENFTAAFTDPDEMNEHERSVRDKLTAAITKKSREVTPKRCSHGILSPWQCHECDEADEMPEGWNP